MALPISNPVTHDGLKDPNCLARMDGLGSITQCSCGTVSVNVQALSLRMDIKALAQLLLMCSDAMSAVEAQIQKDARAEPTRLEASAFVH